MPPGRRGCSTAARCGPLLEVALEALLVLLQELLDALDLGLHRAQLLRALLVNLRESALRARLCSSVVTDCGHRNSSVLGQTLCFSVTCLP